MTNLLYLDCECVSTHARRAVSNAGVHCRYMPTYARAKKFPRYLVTLLVAGVSFVANASQKVRFASERASVPIPDSFRVVAARDELVATFGTDDDHRLELSLI